MKIAEIIEMPTSIPHPKAKPQIGFQAWHESCTRSYHIVGKVKDWLRLNAPPELVIELIEFMESRREKEAKENE